ncbi:hypothetical protein [Streptomyces sp. NPDC060184]|uniref:hypothetical protein n=1 Tax=Streptomyces sp. NPDC060184 TaxID=3347064 RepID=UPI003665A5E6
MAELGALSEAPGEPERAEALRDALVARAAEDPEFAAAMDAWLRGAPALSEGSVTNTISGGTQHGAVVQGRDFSHLTFGGPPAPPTLGS